MRDKCKYFNGCLAPLCIQDTEGLSDNSWYCDEEICQKKNVPLFVKNQRKVAQATNYNFDAGYFTYAMLDRKFRICPGLKGLDLDKPLAQEALQLEKWFEAHPVIQVTEEQREHGRKLAEKNFSNKERR